MAASKVRPRIARYKHPLYNTWRTMLSRCENPKSKDFARYGGRGIRVCARWHDFALFVLDMGERPRGFSLEREEVGGDYCPGNCRWATPKEQSNNQTSNRIITIDGVRRNVQGWAEVMGLPYQEAYYRLVTKPKRKGTNPCLTS